MPITVVVGEQRGDEGKGRIVDMLASDADIVARYNGGPNAGHTVVLPNGEEFSLHLLPAGISHEYAVNVIGNGTLIDPGKLCGEIDKVGSQGVDVTPDRMKISSAAHLIMPHHISADEIRETGKNGQGTTKAGIAQAAADKYMRINARMDTHEGELSELVARGIEETNILRATLGLAAIQAHETHQRYMDSIRRLSAYVIDTQIYLNEALKAGKHILAEGAQAFWLDIDQGMYPYVTSSATTVGGVPNGLGVSPLHISRIIGVTKATQSHVGGGPFVTEITDPSVLGCLRGKPSEVDGEFGTTTGRARRMGYLDVPQLRRAQMVNGTQEIGLTKLDCLPRYGKTVLVCTAYKGSKDPKVAPASAAELAACEPIYEELPTWGEDIQDARKFDDLPESARHYVDFLESETGLPVSIIGVGPRRDQVILR